MELVQLVKISSILKISNYQILSRFLMFPRPLKEWHVIPHKYFDKFCHEVQFNPIWYNFLEKFYYCLIPTLAFSIFKISSHCALLQGLCSGVVLLHPLPTNASFSLLVSLTVSLCVCVWVSLCSMYEWVLYFLNFFLASLYFSSW